jgi:hypothetical protein
MKKLSLGFLVVCLLAPQFLHAADGRKPVSRNLRIAYDANADRIVVTWNGKGVLKQATEANGKFHPVRIPANQNYYLAQPGEKRAVYKVENASDGPPFSLNIVGYVNLVFPPGLSLLANPLYSQNYSNQVAYWWSDAPDGSQVLKYVPGAGYEVSTYDGLARAWSNPGLEVPLGEGFYFRNPSSQAFTNTFVGEVRLGYLTNTLPAGYSMKGSLVPQAGSINSVHGIPGEANDELRTLTNEFGGDGTQNISRFSAESNQWVPDLILNVGQGFWIHKQRSQNWVRYFEVTN